MNVPDYLTALERRVEELKIHLSRPGASYPAQIMDWQKELTLSTNLLTAIRALEQISTKSCKPTATATKALTAITQSQP